MWRGLWNWCLNLKIKMWGSETSQATQKQEERSCNAFSPGSSPVLTSEGHVGTLPAAAWQSGSGERLRQHPSFMHFLGLRLQNVLPHLLPFAPRYAWRHSPAIISSLQGIRMLCDKISSLNAMLGRGDICPVWMGSRWGSSGCIRTVVQALVKCLACW